MDSSFSGEIMHFFNTTGVQFWKNLQETLSYLGDHLGDLLWRLFGVVFIFFCANLLLRWISYLTSRTMRKNRQLLPQDQSRRVDTLMTLIRSAARYLIYFVALLLVLGQFGGGMAQNVLLAVGSIGGIAFGFGAQNLVKDVVTGLFMIFENQFSVGDYIQTEDATGTVEATAVRVTYLRSAKGDQIIIPNGSIERVINYTRGSYIATIVVSTAYEANTRQVMGLMEEALREYGEAHQERGMRLAIKEAFDRRGIEFPYPRMVTIPWGEHLSPSPEEEDTPPFGWVPSPAPEFAEEDLLDSGLEDSADEDADGDGAEENSK